MISFACKKIELSQLIKCSFGMNKTEFNVMMYMLGKEEMRVEEIAQGMTLERSTVQKAIKNLVEKSIVHRSQENLEKGGYLFRYLIKDKPVIKRMVLESVDTWQRKVVDEINRW
ncbi:TPA: MarR family transcriptional regulator [Candidatus Woesearchaeota archaeon]|nr:MarR family transcriptional regulator [Candidatus Woesearchaeota archaeon]